MFPVSITADKRTENKNDNLDIKTDRNIYNIYPSAQYMSMPLSYFVPISKGLLFTKLYFLSPPKKG